ncbi:Ner family transcriptional regulator [Azospirillaceae bacterium]
MTLRGLSFTEIGRREGVSQQAVKSALWCPSQYLEEAIARAIGLTPQALFPERFDASGRRLHKSRQPNRSTPRPACNDQVEVAA